MVLDLLAISHFQGLYDLHIQMMGIPLLPWEPPEMSYDITASQVMNKPVVTLRAVERVTRIVDVLGNMPHLHSGFPVVEETASAMVKTCLLLYSYV